MKSNYKKMVIKILPDFAWDLYRWYSYKRNSSKTIRNKGEHSKVFTTIYESNYWNDKESLSGTGSNFEQTRVITSELPILFKRYSIKTMLDIPCGDFNWMQQVDLSEVNYIGADIVPKMIDENVTRYSSDKVIFRALDLVNDKLPKVDLIFCRDCLVHLSYDQISKAIFNIKLSGSKYLLTTSFVNRTFNFNIQTGDWRPINLKKKPFNFINEIEVIDELCTEGNGKSYDKSLVLYNISELPFVKKDE